MTKAFSKLFAGAALFLATSYVTTPLAQADDDPVLSQLSQIQSQWAHIKYEIADEDEQLEAIRALEQQASEFALAAPNRAEPLIWQAIILATDAGIDGGLGALSKVRAAKELLEKALQLDDQALDGSAYTSLGSLYYQVPGWPISYGDDDEAESYLKKALTINPNGIDPNYFMGDFLKQDGREQEARQYFEKALQAPDRPSRPIADRGRRAEINAALATITAEK